MVRDVLDTEGAGAEITARRTLERARFFATLAEAQPWEDREPIMALLEAAIIYGRNVGYHLRAEFKERDTFARWYDGWRSKLEKSVEYQYLNEQRDVWVHEEGLNDIGIMVPISVYSVITFTGSAEVRVMYAKPWYRRPDVLIATTRDRLTRPYRRWRRWRQNQRERERREEEIRRAFPAPHPQQSFMSFNDDRIRDRSCFEVMRAYLDALEEVVDSAAEKFKS